MTGRIVLCFLACVAAVQAAEPQIRATQNPSPMVEHTRTHPRLKEERPTGKREPLTVGSLFLPEKLPPDKGPLLIHFHGGTWIPEVAAAGVPCAVVSVQLGSGSSVYGRPFVEPAAFAKLLQEAETQADRKFAPVVLSAWSAGYGAIRAILRSPEHYQRVQSVLLLDGLHAGYVDGKPGPKESSLVAEDLAVFVEWAADAVAGKKQFLVTHTEIFPGTFASTTETADYLLQRLKLARSPCSAGGRWALRFSARRNKAASTCSPLPATPLPITSTCCTPCPTSSS